MNEFIIWDDSLKFFWGEGKEFLIEEILISHPLKRKDTLIHLQFFKKIGKIDINGNEIYADSSIVEFEYEDRIPTLFDDDVVIKFTAFFQYNSDELRYELIILDYDKNKTKSIYSVLSYNMDLMSNFKIIGTLQQDKHLLGEDK